MTILFIFKDPQGIPREEMLCDQCLRTCDQCFGQYEAGSGVSEDDRSKVRLSERFCSQSCADEYNEQIDDHFEEEQLDQAADAEQRRMDE